MKKYINNTLRHLNLRYKYVNRVFDVKDIILVQLGIKRLQRKKYIVLLKVHAESAY